MRLEALLKATARRLGIPYETVLKDYSIGHLLAALAGEPTLASHLVMKGGTALRALYFADYRFSEDLDFSAEGGPRGDPLEATFRSVALRAQSTLSETGPTQVTLERAAHHDPHPHGQEDFVFRTQFPWQRQPMCTVKVEVTVDEPIALPAAARPILHGDGETFAGTIRVYSLEEIVAEKLRALLQNEARRGVRRWVRPRCRDVYDLWYILSNAPAGFMFAEVRRILPSKCVLRGVAFARADDFFPAPLLEIVGSAWDDDLGHLVPDLPDVDDVIVTLREQVNRLIGSTV